LVPVVVDGIDFGIVGTLQIALELKVVGRIGEHKIDAIRRELVHLGDAVAHDDAVRLRSGRWVLKMTAGRPDGRPATRHYHDSEL
jgi:hypothetical protein